eukprot:Anaeramoba_ignava/a219508_17.p1 GENE.a219508_17~~a219508_17.p1  ORF type:complete len:100 (+),score=23.55 a219508_17:814-1113(+)
MKKAISNMFMWDLFICLEYCNFFSLLGYHVQLKKNLFSSSEKKLLSQGLNLHALPTEKKRHSNPIFNGLKRDTKMISNFRIISKKNLDQDPNTFQLFAF